MDDATLRKFIWEFPDDLENIRKASKDYHQQQCLQKYLGKILCGEDKTKQLELCARWQQNVFSRWRYGDKE